MVNEERAKLKEQCEATVSEYALYHSGHFVALSDDQDFVQLLQDTLQKTLRLTLQDTLTLVFEPGLLLRVIRELFITCTAPVLILERLFGGRDLCFIIRQLKTAYPDLKIIVLTGGVEQERLMYLHENGADNFISKPVSAKTLLAKIAFTLKPHGKLGQLIEAARKKLREGKKEEALLICKQVLEIRPDSAAGFLAMGDVLLALERKEAAKHAFLRASQLAELFLEPLHRLAELYGEEGDEKQRLQYLKRMDVLSPLNLERKVDMGGIHLHLGEEEEAKRLFNAAVSQASMEALNQITFISSRIADLYVDTNPTEAEKYLRSSLEVKKGYLSREDIQIFNRLGISLRQQGRWNDAILEYKKALKIAPDDENLYYNIGMACAEGKDFATAKAHLLRVLELNPDFLRISCQVAYNIGAVFIQANDKNRGQRCLKAALELNPDFVLAKRALLTVEDGL